MGPAPPLSWHAHAAKAPHGSLMLCHTADGLTPRESHLGSRHRSREQGHPTAGGRDVLKYLPPRWPSECQVACEYHQHLMESPSEREPYYTVRGDEPTPSPVGRELGRVLFSYKPDHVTRAFSKSCPERLEPPVELESDDACAEDSALQFESRFESGNLEQAVHVSGNYYELRMRTDLYTQRHTQWFYFRVTNMRPNQLYRFSVTNFARCSTLYSVGLRPLMYSTTAAQRTGDGWRRVGDDVAYFPYHAPRNSEDQEPAEVAYVLTFTMEFPYDDDVVFLASGLPYTFSTLQDHLKAMQMDPYIASICHQRVLCRSLAGNPVFLLTITSADAPAGKSKRAVVLTARVHPAETQASWMMRGILNFLTSQNSVAEMLRQRFVFKIVPMLNPDGVIAGNARCSLAGRDMNRQFKHTHRDVYPAVWHLKLLVRRLMEESGVTVYCDFHGHSRRQNAFIYGCGNRRNSSRYLTEKVFPYLLDRMARNLFDFDSCNFEVHKSKEGTGRVVMWAMGITNSYTLEASAAGSNLRVRTGSHYRARDFELIGQRFCEALLEYVDTSPLKERIREKILDTLKEQYGYKENENSESSSADDSDEAGSGSKTRHSSGGRKKWSSKRLQTFISWKKKAPQPLSRVTLRPPREESATTNGSRSISLTGKLPEPSALQVSPVLENYPSLRTATCQRRRTARSPVVRPSSARRPPPKAAPPRAPLTSQPAPMTSLAAVASRLLPPVSPRQRSLSLTSEHPSHVPPAVASLAASTQRLSLRVPPSSPRARLCPGQLPNSPVRHKAPAPVTRRAPDTASCVQVLPKEQTSEDPAPLEPVKKPEAVTKQRTTKTSTVKKKCKPKKSRKAKTRSKSVK